MHMAVLTENLDLLQFFTSKEVSHLEEKAKEFINMP